MKKLKITIAGEVKTFDLPYNGEYKCEVTESYVPKDGDCVIIKPIDDNISYWCKITDAATTYVYFDILVNSRLETSKKGFFQINENRIYTKITPEELKAKYAEAGYDWDYESDTIKPIKWVPKAGYLVWYLNVYMEVQKFIFSESGIIDRELLEKNLLFPTEEECQKFADHCWAFINKKNK